VRQSTSQVGIDAFDRVLSGPRAERHSPPEE
jgi:hypothetical protein